MARARRVAAAPVDVTRFLSYRILALSNTLGRWAAREYPARFGLTLPQWRILSVIATRGAPTAQEIGETVLHLTTPAGRRITGAILYVDAGLHIADDAGMVYLPRIQHPRYHAVQPIAE